MEISGLLAFGLFLIIVLLVAWLIIWAVGYLGAPDPLKKVAVVAVVIIAALIILARALPLLGVAY